MPRKPTGQVIEPKDGRAWALRVPLDGRRHYVTLGTAEEGWNRERVEAERDYILAQIERGEWRPPEREPAPVEEPKEVPSFHTFASEWLESRRGEITERTVTDYEWALSHHLLPTFKDMRLDAIDVRAVDAYRTRKVQGGKLGPAQINKTLKVLAMILDRAIEYEVIDRANPARGRRRRVKQGKPDRTWVEPEQLPSLIEAADVYLRPVLATLAGTGMRPSEAVAVDWPTVSLATGTLTVGRAKTDAGAYREIDLPEGLREALLEWRAFKRPEAGDPLLVNRAGTRQSVENIDRRIKGAIKKANERLGELGIDPISEKVTPYSLRRTYASLRAACGDDIVYTAAQMGHEDPTFTIRVYSRAVKRRGKLSGAHLTEFDRALEWAAIGQQANASPSEASTTSEAEIADPASPSHNQHAGR